MKFETPFIHVHKSGDADLRPLLLLHGTGGNETDLVSLAQTMDPRRAIISPRGLVSENGMNRFFRRFAEGVFDEEDVRFRAGELREFIVGACKAYDLSPPMAVGYSNGANIAAALLFLHPEVLSGAILLRAMAPLSDLPKVDLSGKPILLLTGAQDTMIPAAGAKKLAETLREAKASLTYDVIPTGHGIVQADLMQVTKFLKDEK
jgi:phospholipase/carboxylesterase